MANDTSRSGDRQPSRSLALQGTAERRGAPGPSRREFLRQAALTGTGLAGLSLLGRGTAAMRPSGAAPSAASRVQSLTADISIQWRQANPLAILADEGQDAWHAGHVNDVLVLADGSGLLVGAETGGVWVITNADQAIPLSDNWDDPDVQCLAAGPDGPRHVYAGCSGSLYEANPASAVPLFNWRPLALPAGAGAVYRIAVLKGARLIVLACTAGVFWSAIPRPGGAYAWKPAKRLPGGGYSGLTLGPGGSVVAAAWGSIPERGLAGIFTGEWEGGELVMRRGLIRDACAADMYRTSLASCQNQPNVMYAVSARAGGNPWIYAVLKSTDGGRNWSRLPTRATRPDSGRTGALESTDPDIAGGQGDYNNCIAVSPTNPNVVVVGWRNGPWVSTDGGLTWRARYLNDNNPHLHADLHALTFDPTDPGGRRFYIGSDGGVAMTPDLGQSFQSHYNRNLLNLQFLSPVGRSFWGMANASYQVPGLVAGGLQDNGGVYCLLEPSLTPWREVIGGDGGSALFIRTGQLLYNIPGGPVQAGRWNGRTVEGLGVIPIKGSRPNAGGLAGPVVELVNSPQFRNSAGQYMYAVASLGTDVYGLFANGDGGDLHWEYQTTVRLANGDAITALGSGDGRTTFAGTATGRIFVLSPPAGPLELNVVPRSDGAGSIPRIIVQSQTLAFALFNRGAGGLVLRLNGLKWETLGGGLPNTTFYSMDTDWTILPKPLFVATDDQVYVSRDDGNTWQVASSGLPRRVHCSDVRFVSGPGTAKYLYLSTYGRSVWRAKLG